MEPSREINAQELPERERKRPPMSPYLDYQIPESSYRNGPALLAEQGVQFIEEGSWTFAGHPGPPVVLRSGKILFRERSYPAEFRGNGVAFWFKWAFIDVDATMFESISAILKSALGVV